MRKKLSILKEEPFKIYEIENSVDLKIAFANIEKIEIELDTFKFYTSVSVIASSKIEGEILEMDSYLKHKMQKVRYLPDLVQKPNDLFDAYTFAQENTLNKKNFLVSHRLLSKHLLLPHARGKVRKMEMVVMQHDTNRIQYEAAPMNEVAGLLKKIFKDIELLMQQTLGIDEVFYYASYIHLLFVNIHPFEDGNGRSGRLLEKWFLAEKLGKMAWCIPSERYYYQNVNQYYQNLSKLGIFYEKLDYDKSLDFLLMLPNALKIK